MRKSIVLLLAILISNSANSQNIFIDEKYSDWSASDVIYQDAKGDGSPSGIDIGAIWAANDQEYMYVRFEIEKEINLQDNNDLTLLIDIDNDLSTGRKVNGIGVEFLWNFGDRDGLIYTASGNSISIEHEDIQLMSSPTVSSTQFELAFKRSFSLPQLQMDINGTVAIRLEDNGFNGDDAPNEIGGMTYSLKENVVRDFHTYDLARRPNTDFRILTYNILADNLFDPSKYNAFRRQFQAIAPDIIALQEVRDFNSSATRDIIADFLPGSWFHMKSGFDIVLVSKYPILEREAINGNAAFLLDMNGQDLVVINMHLPCCDNNVDRQKEADNIIAYIRDLKVGLTDIQVPANTPIIVTGDSNLVGFSSQLNTLLTGDIQNNATYGPDAKPDWDNSDLEDAKPFATGTPYTKTWYNAFGSFSSGRLDYVLYTGSTLFLRNTYALSSRDMTSQQRATYGLQASDTDVASDHLPTVADFSLTSVNTEDEFASAVNVYPNPTDGVITLNIPSGSGTYRVNILDYSGKLLYNLVLNASEQQISLHDLPTGVYLLNVVDQQTGAEYSEKVVKN